MVDPFELVQDVLDERDALIASGVAPDLRKLCGGDSGLLARVEAALGDLATAERLLGPLDGASFPSTVSFGTDLQIVRVLGSGGQGRVYLARDEALRRDVVVKASHWTHEAAALRLRAEAEIAARLDCLGVPSILGSGTTSDGVPFFVMRYVRGSTLEERLQASDRAHDPEGIETENCLRAMLQAFVSAAQTVAYAHRRGIVHCDLKPRNILIGEKGDTLVLDWGAAAPLRRGVAARNAATLLELSHSATLRQIASELRTPCYVAPERTEPESELGIWTDVFALGVILARIIGLPIVPAPVHAAIVQSGSSALMRPAIRKRLTAVASEACRERPEDRTQSAAAVADAVANVLRSRGSLLHRPSFRSLWELRRLP